MIALFDFGKSLSLGEPVVFAFAYRILSLNAVSAGPQLRAGEKVGVLPERIGSELVLNIFRKVLFLFRLRLVGSRTWHDVLLGWLAR